jgi:hypothetical protein
VLEESAQSLLSPISPTPTNTAIALPVLPRVLGSNIKNIERYLEEDRDYNTLSSSNGVAITNASGTKYSHCYSSKLNWSLDLLNKTYSEWKGIRYSDEKDGIIIGLNVRIQDALQQIEKSSQDSLFNLKLEVKHVFSKIGNIKYHHQNVPIQESKNGISMEVEEATFNKYGKVLEELVEFAFRLADLKDEHNKDDSIIISVDTINNAYRIIQKGM